MYVLYTNCTHNIRDAETRDKPTNVFLIRADCQPNRLLPYTSVAMTMYSFNDLIAGITFATKRRVESGQGYKYILDKSGI